MEAGLNLFSIRSKIQTEADLLSTARYLKQKGYSYLQYSGAPFDKDKIKRVVEEEGMPIYLTHVSMDRIINDTSALIDEHLYFGCKNIGLGMMPKDKIVDKDAFVDTVARLNLAGQKMADRGCKFFYHHHYFEFLKHDGQTCLDYMIDNAPYINFTIDTHWLQYGGVNVNEYIKRLRGRMDCVHLKDYKIGEDFNRHFAYIGEGTIDFKTFVPIAKEMGAKYFFVEQDNATELPDGMEQVVKSIKYIKEQL